MNRVLETLARTSDCSYFHYRKAMYVMIRDTDSDDERAYNLKIFKKFKCER